jgi:hypothetical protein
MHLAPIFCGIAGWGQIEQLRQYLAQPPSHSGWAPLSWPPVVMTLIGAAAAAKMPQDAAELAYRFIDASYRSTDSRELDEHGGLPGVTREHRRTITVGKWAATDYVNAGIEGYGWGALSIHLLIRSILGLREEKADSITIAPILPEALRMAGKSYRVEPIPWGKHYLSFECLVREKKGYKIRLRCLQRQQEQIENDLMEHDGLLVEVSVCEWEGTWGEERTLQLPQLTQVL